METLVFGVLRWVVIAVLLVVTLFPMYYMVLLSLRSLDEVVLHPAALWPAEFDWSTYVQVLVSEEEGGQGFLVFLRNSAILAVLTVVFTLLAAIPGAYAISRLEFFGRRQVSALFLAVYLFPATLLAVLRFIFTFNEFDDIYLLTGGGAGTQVVSVRVYDLLTSRGDVGAASAQALVLALILVVLVGLYFRFVGRPMGDTP